MPPVVTLNVDNQPCPEAHDSCPSTAANGGTVTRHLSGVTALQSRHRHHRHRSGGRTDLTVSISRPLTESVVYFVRRMESRDLAPVVHLMLQEGWNVDFDNMASVFFMQPDLYFVAQSSRGEIVGHCSTMCLDERVGMLSYILTSSHHQKQGLGSRMMASAKKALDGRTMAFYSVEDAVDFYKKRDFDTRSFSALVKDFTLTSADLDHLPELSHVNVVRARDVPFDKINRYDSNIQGMERPDYLRHWILRRKNVTFVALDVVTEDVVGYISLSFYKGRWDISPLYADSDNIAMQLLKKAAADIAEPVRAFVRVPADSSKSVGLFSRMHNLKHHRELYLMSDGVLPSVCSDRVYSLSTVCYGLI